MKRSIIIASLGLMAAGLGGVALFPAHQAVSPAAAATLPTLDELLNQRSPGARLYGAISDKLARVRIPRYPMGGFGGFNGGEEIVGDIPPTPYGDIFWDVDIPLTPAGYLPFVPLLGTPSSGVPGLPGSPFVPVGPAPPPVTPVIPPAVPEPSTWAMLLVGFALVGAAMRRSTGQLVSA